MYCISISNELFSRTTVNMDSKMLNILRCPVCTQHLVGKIFICIGGHSICCDCKKKLSECPTCAAKVGETRNYLLEEFMQSMKFPCEFAENGCQELVKSDELEKHRGICEYRKYKCPYCANWEGYVSYLRDHLRQTHSISEIRNICNNYGTYRSDIFIVGVMNYSTEKSMFLCYDGNLFYVFQYLVGRRIIYFVQHIGSTNKTIRYSYSIEAYCKSGVRRISSTEVCANDLQTVDEIIESGRYIAIPEDYTSDCDKISLQLSQYVKTDQLPVKRGKKHGY